MATSAMDQAQALVQQYQQQQQQQNGQAQPVGPMGPQVPPPQIGGSQQQVPNQLPAWMQAQAGGAQTAQQQMQPPASSPGGVGASYQQHSQNPNVQNALSAIGQFLGQIGHPLAGFFSGAAGAGANAAAAGQSGGAAAVGQALGNMYQQAAQGSQGQTLNTQPGMTAPGSGPIGQSLTGGNPQGMGQQPLQLAGR